MAGGNSGSLGQGLTETQKMFNFLDSDPVLARNKAQQLVNLLIKGEFSGIDSISNFVNHLPDPLKQDDFFREKLGPVLEAAVNANIPRHWLGRFFRYACLSCVESTDPIYTAKYDQCVKFFELFRALGELVDQDPKKSAIRRALVSFAEKNAVDGINDETSSSLTELMQKLCEKGFLMPLMLCVHAYMKSEVTDVLITLAASANGGSGAGVSSESVQVRGDTLQSYIDQLMSIYVEHKKIIESDCLASQTSSIYSSFTRDDVFSAQQQLEKIMKEITRAYNLRLQEIYDNGTVLVDRKIIEYTTPQASVGESFFSLCCTIRSDEDKRVTNRLTRCRLILDLLTAAPKDVDQKFKNLKADPTFEQYFSDGSPTYARWIADINARVPRLKNPVPAAGAAPGSAADSEGEPVVQRPVWKLGNIAFTVGIVLLGAVVGAGVAVSMIAPLLGLAKLGTLLLTLGFAVVVGAVNGIGLASKLNYRVALTDVAQKPVNVGSTAAITQDLGVSAVADEVNRFAPPLIAIWGLTPGHSGSLRIASTATVSAEHHAAGAASASAAAGATDESGNPHTPARSGQSF